MHFQNGFDLYATCRKLTNKTNAFGYDIYMNSFKKRMLNNK